jgi:hypothetical protein
MRSVLSIVLAMILLVVILLDGGALYAAYQNAEDLSRTVAQTAAITLVGSAGNEATAQKAALDYAVGHNGELLKLELHKAQTRWYEATVRVEPSTFVFKFVPFFNKYLQRDSTSVVQF